MRVKCNPDGVKEASRVLSGGGVVVFPTDTVYGIGCSPFDKDAVRRIYRIKNRDPAKPLPVLAYSKEAAKEIAVFDDGSERIAGKMWPGPLTIILKIRDGRLEETLGVKGKIAVRVPDHGCALELLRQCRYVVGTSANVSGARPATDPTECEKDMSGYDLLLDGGKIASGGESTVVELVRGELVIHRKGEIKKEEILDVL